MICPSCASNDTKVTDSRMCNGDRVRKRTCKNCGNEFSTAERITAEYMQVRKRDGSIEPFSRAKLRQGIRKAEVGGKWASDEVETYVDRVIKILQPETAGLPVSSSHIGHLVLQALRNDDRTDVVRARYAIVQLGRTTVEQGFRTIADFLEWLTSEHGEARVAKPVSTPATVVKRDGSREPFELEKLARSIGIAAKGRGTDAEVRNLAYKIATAVQHQLRGQALVTSGQVAGETLKALQNEDPLAYLRYASAVKHYQSVDDFWMDAFGSMAVMAEPTM